MIVQNDFTKQWDAVGPAVIRAAERVGASGRYILGRELTTDWREVSELIAMRLTRIYNCTALIPGRKWPRSILNELSPRSRLHGPRPSRIKRE